MILSPATKPPCAMRWILHVDMDAFYASVEQHDRPDLAGRPVLVGSARRRGVVAAASYEARRHGCRSAQPMAIALRRCPGAVVMPPRFERYAEVSQAVFAIFRDLTPCVEPLSIDEAFLDVTGTERLHGTAVEVARRIRARIRAEQGLTASVGVAPNKFLAKLASDLEKPDGLTVITPQTAERVLAPLPVQRIWGIGPVTARNLEAHAIRTIGDLVARPARDLELAFGAAGAHWAQLARGEDDRPVETDDEVRSVGHETTFEEDLEELQDVRGVLLHLTEDVGRRLRRRGLGARTVTVKIRYGAFETITRAATLPRTSDVTDELWHRADDLLGTWARAAFRPVRLIGVSVSHLGAPGGQLDLFRDADHERRRRLDEAVDRIRDRFGRDAIRRRPEA